MGLPNVIEIVPPGRPVQAEITVPGSKSITNRALILAALTDGQTTLRGALWSEDTQVMVEALQKLGFEVKVEPDANDICNRTITVNGLGGPIPNAGTREAPLDIFVGNAGTAARFLAAFVCLGRGAYRLHGVARMHERPQASLFSALRELGYGVEATNDRLPAVIHGSGPRTGQCTVSIEQSSQFASALLLSAGRGGWRVNVVGENSEESPYVRMTAELQARFQERAGAFEIEPDASSGSYFWAAGYLLDAEVSVRDWPRSGFQVDARFPAFLGTELTGLLFGGVREEEKRVLDQIAKAKTISRQDHLGDSIMTAIVIAPFRKEPYRFVDLGRLRVQECERVTALRTELARCGAKLIESGDTLEIFPSALQGAEIETYDDHRMAMCFAILGLKVPGIRIKNPACVNKTFPNFFQKLATAPPAGLGATILDGGTGRKLGWHDLFAD
jgi:3-phosphoshikimate 1-carboxyvinyltransferase